MTQLPANLHNAAAVKAAGKVLLYEKSLFPLLYFSVMRTLEVVLQSRSDEWT